MTKLEKHQLATTVIGINESSINPKVYGWKVDEKQDIYIKYLFTKIVIDYLLIVQNTY